MYYTVKCQLGSLMVLDKKYLRWLYLSSRVLFIKNSSRVKIVIASDSSHFNSLCNLLESITRNTNIKIIFYDLGLRYDEIIGVKRFKNVEFHNFQFDKYPNFVRNPTLFSWKPQIIRIESQDYRGVIIYMDAGNLVISNLDLLVKFVNKYHFITTFSTGILKDFTSPITLEKLGVIGKELNYQNVNGALLGFDTRKMGILKLLNDWSSLSLDENIIAPNIPKGVTHRYDQSLLTILSNRLRIVKNVIRQLNTTDFGVLIHQDID